MSDQAGGYVRSREEIEPRTGVKGHLDMNIYRFAKPFESSRWLHVTLNDIAEGGGIDLHYHEGLDADHAYYVVDGEVIAWIGDEEFRLGPHSIMFFPTSTVHGFKVISPGGARVLRLGASPDGVTTGNSVWVGAELRLTND